MKAKISKVVMVSGYFNPLHGGHVKMINSAKALGDFLVVIVNNDDQQVMKKGKVIMNEEERAFVVGNLEAVDFAFIAIDEDRTVCKTIESVYKSLCPTMGKSRFIFANGGDRQSTKDIPETVVCNKFGIEMVFGVGGNDKFNSSSAINKLLGRE